MGKKRKAARHAIAHADGHELTRLALEVVKDPTKNDAGRRYALKLQAAIARGPVAWPPNEIPLNLQVLLRLGQLDLVAHIASDALATPGLADERLRAQLQRLTDPWAALSKTAFDPGDALAMREMQHARSQRLNGKHSQALESFQQALAQNPVSQRARGLILHEIAFTYSEMQQYVEAVDAYKRAAPLLESAPPKELAVTLRMLGQALERIAIIRRIQGVRRPTEYREAIEALERSVDLAERGEDAFGWKDSHIEAMNRADLARLMVRAGDVNDLQRARTMFQNARELYVAAGGVDPLVVPEYFVEEAECGTRLGDTLAASESAERALAELDRFSSREQKDRIQVAHLRARAEGSMVNSALVQGRPEDAARHAAKVLKSLRRFLELKPGDYSRIAVENAARVSKELARDAQRLQIGARLRADRARFEATIGSILDMETVPQEERPLLELERAKVRSQLGLVLRASTKRATRELPQFAVEYLPDGDVAKAALGNRGYACIGVAPSFVKRLGALTQELADDAQFVRRVAPRPLRLAMLAPVSSGGVAAVPLEEDKTVDAEKRVVATRIVESALTTAVVHEAAHVLFGHLALTAEQPALEIDARWAMEIDADVFAARATLDAAIRPFAGREVHDESLDFAIRIWLLGLYLSFRAVSKDLVSRNASHPSIGHRVFVAVRGAALVAPDMGIPRARILQHFGEAVEAVEEAIVSRSPEWALEPIDPHVSERESLDWRLGWNRIRADLERFAYLPLTRVYTPEELAIPLLPTQAATK